MTVKEKKLLLALFSGVFLLRVLLLAVFIQPGGADDWEQWWMKADTRSYIRFAESMYAMDFSQFPHRMPGYPLFIIATRTLLGVEWAGTLLLQQVISIVCAWMLYRIARFYYPAYALAVPLLFLLEPVSLIYSFTVMPETCMLFLQIAAVYLLLLAGRKDGRQRLLFTVYSAAALAAGVFFKPVLVYAFVLFAAYVLFFFKGKPLARIGYILLFTTVFQTPQIAYKEIIRQNYGLFSMNSQEFSEKAGRAIDIKLLAENGKPALPDSVRAELNRALRAGGYNPENPDYLLYARINDSIATTNLKQYWKTVLWHSFADSYMFFQPGTQIMAQFFNLEKKAGSTAVTAEDYVRKLEGKGWTAAKMVLFLYSVLVTLVLLLPFALAMFQQGLRKEYSPLIFTAVIWFFYTSVLVGRIAQARYRITFVWAFILLAGAARAWWKERGRPVH